MDDLSSLLQVRFRESWRGYDTAEVDAYVDRVGSAIARAQDELTVLAEQVAGGGTDSEDRSAPGGESAADAGLTADGLAHALDSSQCAAEEQQKIAAAESQAEAMIASARVEALQIRSEADEYAEATYADAEKLARERAAAAADEERRKYESEISDLREQRSQLVEDLEILGRHVAEQRQEIGRSLSELTDLVTSPDAFRVHFAPSSDFDPDGDHEDEAAALESEDDPPQSIVTEPGDGPSLDSASVFDDEIDSLPVDEPLKVAGEDELASTGSVNGRQRFLTAADLEDRRPFDELSWGDRQAEDGSTLASLYEPAPRDAVASRRAVATRREEEPFLAQLREAASRDNMRTDSDDALSAFFNQEEDQRRPPWFLGGR